MRKRSSRCPCGDGNLKTMSSEAASSSGGIGADHEGPLLGQAQAANGTARWSLNRWVSPQVPPPTRVAVACVMTTRDELRFGLSLRYQRLADNLESDDPL